MCIPAERPGAIARIAGSEQAPCLYGTVKFYEMGENVLVAADLCGLPENESGIFAMHIHTGMRCSGPAFEDTGGHFDPTGRTHPRHAGDLPPLFSCGGKAFLVVLTDRFCLREIMGRTVVIHAGPDDMRSQPAGNSGEKIACGVIRAF